MKEDKYISLLTRISDLYSEEITEDNAPLYQLRIASLINEIEITREKLCPSENVLDAETDIILKQEQEQLERYLKSVTQLRTAGDQSRIIEQKVRINELISKLKEQKC